MFHRKNPASQEDPSGLVHVKPDRLISNPPWLGEEPVAVLCAGTPDRVRTVAARWAGFVVYWGSPSVVVATRTSRYVREFCEQHKNVDISVLRRSKVPELKTSSPEGPMPQTPVSSVHPIEVAGHLGLSDAELVLSCKVALASEMSDELRGQLAPTKAELKELGRQSVIVAYVLDAWERPQGQAHR